MPTVNEVYEFLNSFAPVTMKEHWDNVGVLIGRPQEQVRGVLVALEAVETVIDQAIEKNVNLLVTHHPVLFSESKISDAMPEGRRLLKLVENRISVISMHTNLDAAPGGVNDILADLLDIKNTEILHIDGVDDSGRAYGSGRFGIHDPVSMDDFLKQVKSALGCHGVKYFDAGKPVEKVAVLGGSGGDFLMDVVRCGCDTFLSADLKYNIYLDAQTMGINLIDAGHFATENPVCPVLAQKMAAKFPELCIELADHRDVISFL